MCDPLPLPMGHGVAKTNAVVSSELWEYDPTTHVWTELLPQGPVPDPRDSHTASVVGSTMVIFGGRRNITAGEQWMEFIGDEWEIDLDPTENVVVTSDAQTVRCYSRLPVQRYFLLSPIRSGVECFPAF